MTGETRKKKPSTPITSQTYDLVVTSSDALLLSYMRLVGAKAWTRILICDGNVMANSRPGIYSLRSKRFLARFV